MTDVDRRSAGRLVVSTALLKNLIFIKCFGFSAGTSLLTGLNNLQLAMSRMMAVTLYSAEKWSNVVDSGASSCRERSCGNDMENNLVLMLCTPSGSSIMSTRYTRVLAHSNTRLRSSLLQTPPKTS